MNTANGTTEFDRRVGDWLEEGPQSVPDWLVDAALAEAHTTAQLSAGIHLPLRLPWRRATPDVAIGTGRIVSIAAGAIGALAVVSAFVLGIVTAPRIGLAPPAPTAPPSNSPAPSGGPIVPGAQVVNVLPGFDRDFYTFLGLATTNDALWTVAVVDDPEGVASRLLRIDGDTGESTTVAIPGAVGQLSPPATDGQTVWTASETGLHRVSAGGEVATLPLSFLPAELTFGDGGLWIARSTGTTLVDPGNGAVLREVELAGSTDRLVGAPAFGSLWQCDPPGTLTMIDPTSGSPTAAFELPANVAANCHSPVRPVLGTVDGEGIIPGDAGAVVDPATGRVKVRLDIGGWEDFLVHDGSLWFVSASTSSVNDIALTRIDPATGGATEFNLDGTLHLNTTFESGYVAVAGEWLWILADGSGDGSSASAPTLLRIPLAELDRL